MRKNQEKPRTAQTQSRIARGKPVFSARHGVLEFLTTVNKLRKYVRIFGAGTPKTGLFASIFLPPGGKKDFRCNPLRPTG
jgi:hypothetical protein